MNDPDMHEVRLPATSWRVVAHVLHRTSLWDIGGAFDVDPRQIAEDIEAQLYASLDKD